MLRKISIYVLVILVFQISVSAQGKYKKIVSRYYEPFSDMIDLESDSVYFSDYMVFKIFKIPNRQIFESDNVNYICDIFWIKNLNDINNTSKKYLFNSWTINYSKYVFPFHENEISDSSISDSLFNILKEDTITFEKFRRFANFYRNYQKKVLLSNDKIPFTLKDFTTKIFDSDSVLFWSYDDIDSIGFFVFKNTFYTAILKYDCWHYAETPGDNDNIIKAYEYGMKVFLPVSKAFVFKPLEVETARQNHFTKSEWYPDDMFIK